MHHVIVNLKCQRSSNIQWIHPIFFCYESGDRIIKKACIENQGLAGMKRYSLVVNIWQGTLEVEHYRVIWLIFLLIRREIRWLGMLLSGIDYWQSVKHWMKKIRGQAMSDDLTRSFSIFYDRYLMHKGIQSYIRLKLTFANLPYNKPKVLYSIRMRRWWKKILMGA